MSKCDPMTKRDQRGSPQQCDLIEIQSEGQVRVARSTTTGDQSNKEKDEDSWLTIHFIFFQLWFGSRERKTNKEQERNFLFTKKKDNEEKNT